MPLTTLLEEKLLLLFFNNTAAALIGDAAGLPPALTEGSLYVSLHTGTLGEASSQVTTEATFGAYARQATARNASDWTITGNILDNVNAITWTEASSGSETITDIGLGQTSSGAGELWWYGVLTGSLLVVTGVTPSFAAGELNVTLE